MANDLAAAVSQGALDALFTAYVRRLDDRQFEPWLDLFADPGDYAIIRHADHLRQNSLLVIGENKEQLRNRIKLGATIDRSMRVHLLSGIAAVGGTDAALAATANFALLRDGAITYAGRYDLMLEADGAKGWKIRRCLVVLQNDVMPETLYLPI